MAIHETVHEVPVEADSEPVYRLIADVGGWPQVFGPTIHVDLLLEQAQEQLLRIWATAQDGVHDWTSRRVLDPRARTVEFQRIVSKPPVATMSGRWSVEPAPAGSRVTLTHRFSAIADDAAAVSWIREAIDRNSGAELSALKQAAELGPLRERLRFTFSDAEMIRGSAAEVFEFVRRADAWPDRLPHVGRVELAEEPGGVQRLEMDTRSPDGTVHTTSSIRLCFPERGTIVYKQFRLPALLAGHTGRWHFEQDDGTVFARSWHTVALDADGIRAVLGPETTVDEARALVRKSLGANSLATLRHAKAYVERGRD